MTNDLRSSLDDLLADGPPDFAPRELARAAWSQGRRRRHLRQAAMAVVALVLLGVGLGTLPLATNHAQLFAPAGGGGSTTVGGYPERVGHQLVVPDLPSRPGPMALLMFRVVHHASYDQPAGWEAVSESGQRWRIPGIYAGNDDYPSLSPDGRELAYLSGVHGPYVIRDLVSGHVTTFPSVGSAVGTGRTTYQTEGQAPAFWSPDGQHLVMLGFPRDSSNGRALVLGIDGSVQLAHERGYPVGWLDARTIVWLTPSTYRGQRPVPVAVQLTGMSGRVERSLPLGPPMRPDLLDQWSAAVSPDGTQLLVIQNSSGQTIRRFSLADGRRIGPVSTVGDLAPICTPAWTDSGPVIPILDSGNVYPAQLTTTGLQRLVAIEPRLGSECVLWATDALRGTRHSMLFGLSMAPWTWWWREILFGVLVAGSVLWFVGRWVVVKRRRAH